MGYDNLTVADVAQMALNMETKGMHFYNWAAKQFDNRLVREMFLRLSEDEKEHVNIFQKLLALPDAEQKLKGDSGRYLKMIGLRGDIFPHHGEITNVSSPAEALSLGIQAEKDAILLYQELYNKAESDEVKRALGILLEEEKMHLVELRDYMDELKHFKH